MILLDKELIAMNEYKNVSEEAVKKGLKKDGVWTLKKLKSMGWVNVSYKKYSTYSKFSDFSARCGYDGCYQKSKLVKGFK